MTDFIKKNKIWLGAILFAPLFFLYIFLTNRFFIPALERIGFSNFTNKLITVSIPISLVAIFLFQFVFIHRILLIRIQQLIQLKHLKETMVFLFVFMLLLLLLQVFPDTRFESENPFTMDGVGVVIELIFGAYVEEIFYRGFLFLVLYDLTTRRFEKIPKKLVGMIFIITSSFLFAVAHAPYYTKMHGSFHWLHLVLPFITGVLLAMIYWNTRNLLICIVLHFTINYRFFQFPLDGGGQDLSYIILTFIIIILTAIGQVIYKKGDVRFIDEVEPPKL